MSKIDETDLREKKNCTLLPFTKSKTNDFPTQDMLYPSPETKRRKYIKYTFLQIDNRKYITA